MKALHLYAGPKAHAHIVQHGLRAEHVGVIPGAAGGPKGLILGPLDRFIFGEWLPQSTQAIELIGASIGAWRMATACMKQAVAGFERLEHDYIHQRFEIPPGQKRPSTQQVSEAFARGLSGFFSQHMAELLSHPRFRLHVVTSHGRHVLHREHPVLTPLGYAGAFVCNALQRKAMSLWLERVVFSSHPSDTVDLPFDVKDFATHQVALTDNNFMPALQASCSIPFVLQAVHDIPGAPRGAYWDGGITDYHLHLNYTPPPTSPIVLYPHFQRAVVPGWLDKSLKWRHSATAFLDHALVLAPNPEWVQTLPNGKLPDRSDFVTYANDFDTRVKVWQQAASASQQLADELAAWLDKPDLHHVHTL